MIGRYPIYQEIRFICQSHRHSTNQRTRWMGGKSIPYWNISPLIWRSCMHALMLRDYCLLDILKAVFVVPCCKHASTKNETKLVQDVQTSYIWKSSLVIMNCFTRCAWYKNMELNDLAAWLEKLSFTNLNGFQCENGLLVFSVK